MPRVPEERPKSFAEYMELLQSHRDTAGRPLWYRGCSSGAHALIPTLYRHRYIAKPADFSQLEQQLVLRFRQRSIPFVSHPLGDDWETLFVMQHHGVPTRLLDWSENPFIGLFFATAGRNFKVTGRPANRKLLFKEDATIWLLDPVAWNRKALSHLSYVGEIPFSNDPALAPYKPPITAYDSRNLPIAINGAHNSSRIVAQRGAFTIFGNSTESMEKIYESENFPSGSLTKIVLEKQFVADFRHSIYNYGIVESVVFPDLEGLARETRREFGFED